MKKFKFSFQAVWMKRDQEERASLRELAVHVANLNKLYAEEQKVRSNLLAWQQDFKDARSSTVNRASGDEIRWDISYKSAFLRNNMQNFLKDLKEKIVNVEKTVQTHQQKVLKQRQETQKIEHLREQEFKKWKRTKNQMEQLQLQEQSLQKYILEHRNEES